MLGIIAIGRFASVEECSTLPTEIRRKVYSSFVRAAISLISGPSTSPPIAGLAFDDQVGPPAQDVGNFLAPLAPGQPAKVIGESGVASTA